MSNINTFNHHRGCGGTLLVAASGTPDAYEYCDRCGAFRFDVDGDMDDFPTGTDREANREAFENGEECSPDE